MGVVIDRRAAEFARIRREMPTHCVACKGPLGRFGNTTLRLCLACMLRRR